MISVGLGEICHQRFGFVAKSVTIGVGHAKTHQPWIAQRVEVGSGIGFVVPADPAVVPGCHGAVGICNDIARARHCGVSGRNTVLGGNLDIASSRIAENRVETMEEFPVVVHAVFIGIPHARIGADIFGCVIGVI